MSLPLRLLWHRRETEVLAAGHYRISVPVSGGPPPTSGGATVQAALEAMWVRYPRDAGLKASSVAVTIAADPRQAPPARFVLIVIVSLDQVPVVRAVDGVHMARHLRSALARISADPAI